MSRFCIVIPTTRDAVELVSITEEIPDIASVLCLKNSFQALPVSPAYDAFIRRPTGIIQKLFGDKSYRTDLSAPITQGQSWQLGVAIGHLVHHHQALSTTEDADPEKDLLIFASGCVLPDLTVVPVNHIPEKSQLSEAFLASWKDRKGRIAIIMHPDNIGQLAFDNLSDVQLVPCTDLSSAGSFIGFDLPATSAVKATPSDNQAKKAPLPLFRLFVTSLSVLILLLTYGIYMSYPDWKAWGSLETDGQHKPLLNKIKTTRENGTWMQTNTAFFYEKYLQHKSEQLSNHLELSVFQNSCDMQTPLHINSTLLPAQLGKGCPFQIRITNNGPENVNILVRQITADESQKNNAPIHGMTLGTGQTSQTPYFSALSQEDVFVIAVTNRPYNFAKQWLTAFSVRQDLMERAISRFIKTGIGLKILTLPQFSEDSEPAA